MRRKTIFIDIDGTCIKHQGEYENMLTMEPEVLPGVLEFFQKHRAEEALIIVTTARGSAHRAITEAQLKKCGLEYDLLIMDVTDGERWVINDEKPDMAVTALGFTVKRNLGINSVDFPEF